MELVPFWGEVELVVADYGRETAISKTFNRQTRSAMQL